MCPFGISDIHLHPLSPWSMTLHLYSSSCRDNGHLCIRTLSISKNDWVLFVISNKNHMGHSRPMPTGPKRFLRHWVDTEDIFGVSSWYVLCRSSSFSWLINVPHRSRIPPQFCFVRKSCSFFEVCIGGDTEISVLCYYILFIFAVDNGDVVTVWDCVNGTRCEGYGHCVGIRTTWPFVCGPSMWEIYPRIRTLWNVWCTSVITTDMFRIHRERSPWGTFNPSEFLL